MTKARKPAAAVSIENEFYTLHFGDDGLLQNMSNKVHGLTTNIRQQWMFYIARASKVTGFSGAYRFLPEGTATFPVSTEPPLISVVKNSIVQEVRQTIAPW